MKLTQSGLCAIHKFFRGLSQKARSTPKSGNQRSPLIGTHPVEPYWSASTKPVVVSAAAPRVRVAASPARPAAAVAFVAPSDADWDAFDTVFDQVRPPAYSANGASVSAEDVFGPPPAYEYAISR